MKLFFISDIHGSLPSLQEALEKFSESGADYLIILGDALYHGPRNPIPDGYNPAACAELLNNYAAKIIAIRGNCDSEVDQMLIKYPMSDTSASVLLENRRFFLTHGHIFHPENQPPLSAGDVFCYGHVHLPKAERGENGVFIFNPGSITLPKEGNPRSYGIFSGNTLQVIAFNGTILAEQQLS